MRMTGFDCLVDHARLLWIGHPERLGKSSVGRTVDRTPRVRAQIRQEIREEAARSLPGVDYDPKSFEGLCGVGSPDLPPQRAGERLGILGEVVHESRAEHPLPPRAGRHESHRVPLPRLSTCKLHQLVDVRRTPVREHLDPVLLLRQMTRGDHGRGVAPPESDECVHARRRGQSGVKRPRPGHRLDPPREGVGQALPVRPGIAPDAHRPAVRGLARPAVEEEPPGEGRAEAVRREGGQRRGALPVLPLERAYQVGDVEDRPATARVGHEGAAEVGSGLELAEGGKYRLQTGRGVVRVDLGGGVEAEEGRLPTSRKIADGGGRRDLVGSGERRGRVRRRR
mmetsp:Transcript_31671/g.72448  ORF Transcript_31671/g.72448 Transcript_31671/m.72448 type:complete len:339 (+) Transcript_31671:696-1712(+)